MNASRRKWIWGALALVAVVAIIGVYGLYNYFFTNNVAREGVFYIRPEAPFTEVMDSLRSRQMLQKPAAFAKMASLKEYPENIKPGRYKLTRPMSNRALVNMLLSGRQEPVRVVLHNTATPQQLAGQLGRQLAPDSLAFLQMLNDGEFLRKHQLKPQHAWTIFLPNSYDFYWDTQPQAVFEKMKINYERFWNDDRRERAAEQNLRPREVLTLASIVERETIKADEMPTVAGLYLNRLEKDMKLQSDPTVIYGIRQSYPDSVIKRVLYSHLRHASPYNTYINRGLPPAPIAIPSLRAIESVLKPQQHDYIFMVANPKKPGYHWFATTLREHNNNRQKYIRWIRRQ